VIEKAIELGMEILLRVPDLSFVLQDEDTVNFKVNTAIIDTNVVVVVVVVVAFVDVVVVADIHDDVIAVAAAAAVVVANDATNAADVVVVVVVVDVVDDVAAAFVAYVVVVVAIVAAIDVAIHDIDSINTATNAYAVVMLWSSRQNGVCRKHAYSPS
jgi:hypothetical protein